MRNFALKRVSAKGEPRTKKVVFEKFYPYLKQETGALCATYSVNCDCRNGSMTTGLGVEKFLLSTKEVALQTEDTPLSIFLHENYNTSTNLITQTLLYVSGNAGKLYKYDKVEESFSATNSVGTNIRVRMADDEGKLHYTFFFSARAISLYWDRGYGIIYSSPTTGAGHYFKNRMFIGANRSNLMFSKLGMLYKFGTTFEEEGVLNFSLELGDLVEMEDLNDKLYLFYEYGIREVTCDGLAEDFKVREIPYGGGKICQNLLKKCGKHIYFLAVDGLWRFDGNRAESVLREMDIKPNYVFSPAQRCAKFQDKILFQYFDERMLYRLLVVYGDGKSGYFGNPYTALTESFGKVLCLVDGYVQEVSENGTLSSIDGYIFNTAETDFGTPKKKRVKRIRFFGDGDFSVAVASGNKRYTKNFILDEGIGEIKTCFIGDTFSFEFTLQKGARIDRVEVEFEIL